MMKEFLETTEPVILEAIVEKDEHVYPMVPAGRALNEVRFWDVKRTNTGSGLD